MPKTIDLAKALAAAIVIMAINVAMSFVAVAVYAYLINPGHEDAYYEAATQQIVTGSAIVVGMLLFFGAGYIFAKRRPERNAVAFAIAIWVGYVALEIVILSGAGALGAAVGIISFSMLTKLAAVVVGAKIA